VLPLTACTPTPEAEAPKTAHPTVTTTPTVRDVAQTLHALEAEYDARVGVVATDTATGHTVAYNAHERFGFASTLKAFAAAEFLHAVPVADRDEHVRWTAEDIAQAGYSPVTEQHIEDGLTYTQLAEAAVRDSDNTAMNLILKRVGGPEGLDRAFAELGDTTTSVVHYEPELNTLTPGSRDDTTTADAFTTALQAYLDEQTLSKRDADTLVDWMSGNATGDALIRAGAPDGWTVADKSGGAGGIRNDIAIVTPPHRSPIIISILTTKKDPAAKYDDSLVERTASAVLGTFDGSPART
jgi:beta-lactamase class A